MAKGSKRDTWIKEGIKTSRKWYKKVWNKKVRKADSLVSGNFFKKLAKGSAWDGIL